MYPTLRATVRQGEIRLLDEVILPENATLLITVLADVDPEMFTLGEHLVIGLQDVLLGRVAEISTSQDLAHHLDSVFDDT